MHIKAQSFQNMFKRCSRIRLQALNATTRINIKNLLKCCRLVTLMVVFFLITMICQYNSRLQSQRTASTAITDIINSQTFVDCDDLFVESGSFSSFNFSAEFLKNQDDYKLAEKSAVQHQSTEGHSGQLTTQQLLLHYLAGLPFVRSICETGFNLGHSSYAFLTAGNASVHSFDLGEHRYAHTLGDFLRRRFPGRFTLHFGHSARTAPKFIKNNPDFVCDLIYVDGGHSLQAAAEDIANFGSIANPVSNVVILDDYPCMDALCSAIGPAWENALRTGLIKESMRCMFKKSGYSRGFTVGQFISNRTRS